MSDVNTHFWQKVDKFGACWLWTGRQTRLGYGVARHAGRPVYAHRFAYEVVVGEIPDGLELDHLCRVPGCVRPDHLEAVPHRVNILRGIAPSAINARKATCVHGHPFDEANTIVRPDGGRACRTCELERNRSERERARSRAYGAAHRTELNARARARRAANGDKVRAIEAAYRERHKDEVRVKGRAKAARRRALHRDKINAQQRAYRAAHRDELNARRRTSKP